LAALDANAGTHFPARAKRVIQIFAVGGMSHIDTLDPKPELSRRSGSPFDMPAFFGQGGNLMGCPFEFRQRGKSGLWLSDLLPHLAESADKLTVIRSMVAKSANHMPAIAQMNTGFILSGFPSRGAWITYALGASEIAAQAYSTAPICAPSRMGNRTGGEQASPDRRTYAGMVRAMDRNIGRVMDALKELRLDRNNQQQEVTTEFPAIVKNLKAEFIEWRRAMPDPAS
jgi:hypothetical protein